MGDLADVYEDVRKQLSDLAAGLTDDELARPVPATPGWRVRDVVAHLCGDATCVVAGDFPSDFFVSIGDAAAVAGLDRWTAGHVSARAAAPVADILDEWERSAAVLVRMMRGEIAWRGDVPFIAPAVLVTDLGVHQHDIYGALGVTRERDGPPVRIGLSGYVRVMDARLRGDGGPALRIHAGDKKWDAIGGDEPAATLRAGRFELFRALSGRRSPQQIRAYDWEGDPEPFVSYFYPYGVRTAALVE